MICSVALSYANGEKFGLKSNILYDAFLSPNLGVELAVSPRWSIDLSGNFNDWKSGDRRQWKHWLVQPEARWWRNRPFHGSFLAAHLLGGEYNVIFKGNRYQGKAGGGGIGYGWSWAFSRNWSLEGEIAVGYVRYSYDKYPCTQCGGILKSGDRNWFGPTKAAVNIVYRINPKEKPVPVIVPDTVQPVEPPKPQRRNLADYRFLLVKAPVTGIRSYAAEGSAELRFPVNSTVIVPDLGLNRSELDKILATVDSIGSGDGIQITHLQLQGVASPEGPYDNNVRLSHGRVEALRDYLASVHEFDFPADSIEIDCIPEDWEGFRKLLLETQLPHKDQILALIDSDMQPDAKEKKLRREYPGDFRVILQDLFPRLRRSNYRVNYVRRYEVEEISALREVNDLIRQDKVDEAAGLLRTVPQSPESDYTHGVVAAMRGNYADALRWLEKAREEGVAEAIDAINIVKRLQRQQPETPVSPAGEDPVITFPVRNR